MSNKEIELAQLRQQHQVNHIGRISSDSKKRLQRIAAKKFRTCFIAALAEFEKVFGMTLWGHQLPEDELTSTQKANSLRWELVRKTILDKGNAQLRALEAEIDLHKVDFEGYSIQFTGRQKDER